ncbi:MAG: hypothetical protein WB384_14890 [Candidatus Sulfotelmatobacter sp.]
MEKAAIDAQDAVLAHQQATVVLEPREGALDFPSLLVPSKFAAVLPPPALPVAAMGNQQFDTASPESLAQRVGVVSPVRNYAPGPLPWTTTSPGRHLHFRERAFRQRDLGR